MTRRSADFEPWALSPYIAHNADLIDVERLADILLIRVFFGLEGAYKCKFSAGCSCTG
jgi:hypothetical protein